MTEKIEKEQLAQNILSNIEHCLEVKKIKQKELIGLCKEKGYTISQSELSRILTHKVALTLYPALAICDTLGIDLERILHPERKIRDRFELSPQKFVTDPERSEIENYLGSYETLFHTTDSRESKLLRGRLELASKSDGERRYCSASFVLNTEDTDMRGEAIYKKYQGQFFVSPQMGIAYCFLINNKLGEICSIEFRHRAFFYKRVECRLGLVLTASSGEKKAPAGHKMVIFRGKLKPEQEELLVHMLKVDNTEIYVEADTLKKVGKTDKEREFFGKLATILPPVSYYVINAAMLKSVDRKLSHTQISSLFSMLRQYSEDEYTMHLDELEDEMVFDLIQRNQQKQEDDISLMMDNMWEKEIYKQNEVGEEGGRV